MDKPLFIQEMDDLIERAGSARDALNVAFAKLQELRAYIISLEKCPNCFGDISPEEQRSDDGHISFYYECFDCGSQWLSIGYEVIQHE